MKRVLKVMDFYASLWAGGKIKKRWQKKLTINQWAEEDRPREKMMLHGVGDTFGC